MRQRVLPRVRRKTLSYLRLEALEDRRVLSGLGNSLTVHPSPAHANGIASVLLVGMERHPTPVAHAASHRAEGGQFVGPVQHPADDAPSRPAVHPVPDTAPAHPAAHDQANHSSGEATDGSAGPTTTVHPQPGVKEQAHQQVASHETAHTPDAKGDSEGHHAVTVPATHTDSEGKPESGHADAAHAVARGTAHAGEDGDDSARSDSHGAGHSTASPAEEGETASPVSVAPMGPTLASYTAHGVHAATATPSSVTAGQALPHAAALSEDEHDAAGHEDHARGGRADTPFTAVARPADAADSEDPAAQFAPGGTFWTSVAVDPDSPEGSAFLPLLTAEEVSEDPLALVGWRVRQQALAAALAEAAQADSLSAGRGAVASEHADLAAQAGLTPSGEAGLASGLLRADTGSLHQAIRAFLGQLDAAGRELTRTLAENPWVRWVVAAALAALASEAARRRLGRTARTGQSGEDDGLQLSALSGSYPFPTSSF